MSTNQSNPRRRGNTDIKRTVVVSSTKHAHVFGLKATTSTIIFPPNSSLKRPGTFLFLPIGRGLLSFSAELHSPELDLSNQTISQHHWKYTQKNLQ